MANLSNRKTRGKGWREPRPAGHNAALASIFEVLDQLEPPHEDIGRLLDNDG